MRFKVGSMVEVLTKKKVPSGVWRCAEIVADNVDEYTVRYHRCSDIVKEGVDKVSVEAVRPRPPPSPLPVTWAVGDIAEVLDNGYWKVSMIEEVLGDDSYQIHVIGSIDEFRVKKPNIRLRQEWKHNKWVFLGKDSGDCDDLIIRARKKALLQQQAQQANMVNVQLIARTSLQLVKRSFSDISSTDEGYSKCVRKRRSVNKEIPLNVTHQDSYSFIGNSGSDGNLKQKPSNDNLLFLTMKGIDHSYAGRKNHNDASFLVGTCSSEDCVSGLSSVASCSVTDLFSDRVLSHSTSCCLEAHSLCSDANSVNLFGDEEGKLVGRIEAWLPYVRILKMVSWLTRSLVSGKGHHLCWITDKPICI